MSMAAVCPARTVSFRIIVIFPFRPRTGFAVLGITCSLFPAFYFLFLRKYGSVPDGGPVKRLPRICPLFSGRCLSHRGILLRLPGGFLRSDGGLYRKEFVMSTDFLFCQRAAEPFEFLIYVFSSFCLFLLFLPLR